MDGLLISHAIFDGCSGIDFRCPIWQPQHDIFGLLLVAGEGGTEETEVLCLLSGRSVLANFFCNFAILGEHNSRESVKSTICAKNGRDEIYSVEMVFK